MTCEDYVNRLCVLGYCPQVLYKKYGLEPPQVNCNDCDLQKGSCETCTFKGSVNCPYVFA